MNVRLLILSFHMLLVLVLPAKPELWLAPLDKTAIGDVGAPLFVLSDY